MPILKLMLFLFGKLKKKPLSLHSENRPPCRQGGSKNIKAQLCDFRD